MFTPGTTVEILKGFFKGQLATVSSSIGYNSAFLNVPNGKTYLYYKEEFKVITEATPQEPSKDELQSRAFSIH